MILDEAQKPWNVAVRWGRRRKLRVRVESRLDRIPNSHIGKGVWRLYKGGERRHVLREHPFKYLVPMLALGLRAFRWPGGARGSDSAVNLLLAL